MWQIWGNKLSENFRVAALLPREPVTTVVVTTISGDFAVAAVNPDNATRKLASQRVKERSFAN
jgi:hypothetical protein